MSKESKALLRKFYVKAEGHQYEMPTYARKQPDDYIDLTNPSEERWIATIIQQVDPTTNPTSMTSKWLTLVEYSAYEKERAKSERLLEALKVYANSEYVDVKQRYRHFETGEEILVLSDNGEIAREAIANYNQSEGE